MISIADVEHTIRSNGSFVRVWRTVADPILMVAAFGVQGQLTEWSDHTTKHFGDGGSALIGVQVSPCMRSIDDTPGSGGLQIRQGSVTWQVRTAATSPSGKTMR
ncbi:hypothetical protein C2L64_47390 [Paraburkholderia hospita]|uniref:Uncharacterized protein n=1 Tax=Paraburkholderia hospita TaxID=169430 RepID=A0AAN1MQN6_9BURK|nr:hypothetical protein C2L64_47390 [Paraburkholderia hospita]